MSKIWQYVKNLFQTAEQSSAQQPLIHELIERSSEEKADYERWKKTIVRRQLCEWLQQQHAAYLYNPEEPEEFLLIAYIYVAKEILDYDLIESKLIESLKRLKVKK